MTETNALNQFTRNPLNMHLVSTTDVNRIYLGNPNANLTNDGIPGSNFYDSFNRNCMRHVSKVISGLTFIQ